MKRVKIFSLLCTLLLLCSCGTNEKLPTLDNGKELGEKDIICKPEEFGLGYIYEEYRKISDDPDDSVYIYNFYPELDFSQIKTLPVYEELYCYEGSLEAYPSISESDKEKYALAVEEIAKSIGVCFERYVYEDEYSDLEEKNIVYYVGAEPHQSNNSGLFEIYSDSWTFYVKNDSMKLPWGECIERDLDKIDNTKLRGEADSDFLAEVKKLDELQAQPLSEDTKAEVQAFLDRLKDAVPFLFGKDFDYPSCGQGSGVRYALRGDGVWLNYTKEDISTERGKLLWYNSFIDWYGVSFGDGGDGKRGYVNAGYYHNSNKLVGEYRIVSVEKAAEELKLEEGEKLAILYIRSTDGNRTLLRPVYTKYRYQEDLFENIVDYIDAIKYR